MRSQSSKLCCAVLIPCILLMSACSVSPDRSASNVTSSKVSDNMSQKTVSGTKQSSSNPYIRPADGVGLEELFCVDYGVGMSASVRDGTDLFVCGGSSLIKYDISDERSPKEKKRLTLPDGDSKFNYLRMVQYGDYLYVGARSYEGNVPKVGLHNGSLVVVKKSDLSVVTNAKFVFPDGGTSYSCDAGTGRQIGADGKLISGTSEKQSGTFKSDNGFCKFNFKLSGLIVHENMLIVNLQMRGWCIFTIDKNDPTVLTLESTTFWSESPVHEHQGGDVFKKDGRIYYIAAGFGDGYSLYDVTDRSKPVLVKNIPFGTLKGDSEPQNVHTFSLVANYPYVYTTVAPSSAALKEGNDAQGLLTLNISDFDNVTYTYTPVAKEDRCTFFSSDSQPTCIVKYGNYLLLNASEKGVSVFKIENDGQPVYMKTVALHENPVYAISPAGENRLFVSEVLQENGYQRHGYLFRVDI